MTKQLLEKVDIKFIKDVVNQALETINDDSLSSSQKRQKLSEYVNKFLDIDRIAKAVFARWGYKNLSLTDQDKVKTYLKQYLVYFCVGVGKLSPMMNATLLPDPVAKSMEKILLLRLSLQKIIVLPLKLFGSQTAKKFIMLK